MCRWEEATFINRAYSPNPHSGGSLGFGVCLKGNFQIKMMH